MDLLNCLMACGPRLALARSVRVRLMATFCMLGMIIGLGFRETAREIVALCPNGELTPGLAWTIRFLGIPWSQLRRTRLARRPIVVSVRFVVVRSTLCIPGI